MMSPALSLPRNARSVTLPAGLLTGGLLREYNPPVIALSLFIQNDLLADDLHDLGFGPLCQHLCHLIRIVHAVLKDADLY